MLQRLCIAILAIRSVEIYNHHFSLERVSRPTLVHNQEKNLNSNDFCSVVITPLTLHEYTTKKWTKAMFLWAKENLFQSLGKEQIIYVHKNIRVDWQNEMYNKYISSYPNVYTSKTVSLLKKRLAHCKYISYTRLDFDDSLMPGFIDFVKDKSIKLFQRYKSSLRGIYFVNLDVHSNKWLTNATTVCKLKYGKILPISLSGWSVGRTIVFERSILSKFKLLHGIIYLKIGWLMIEETDEMLMKLFLPSKPHTKIDYTRRYKYDGAYTNMTVVISSDLFHPVGNYSATPLSGSSVKKKTVIPETCYKKRRDYLLFTTNDTCINNHFFEHFAECAPYFN